MPPTKKRKAAPPPTTPPPTVSSRPARKKVRIGDESAIGDDDDNTRASTPASGRLRRTTTNDSPRYNFTNTRGGTAQGAGRGGSKAKAKGKGVPTQTAAAKEEEEEVKPVPKKKGRPGKNPVAVEVEAHPQAEAEEEAEEDEVEAKAVRAVRKGILKNKHLVAGPAVEVNADFEAKPATQKKKRGRPAKKTKSDDTMDGLTDEEALNKGAAALLHEAVDPEVQYWLMKAEPESRIEKGVDVKFSIDDLSSKTEPEGWDGVRNPVARNNMRSMRLNDLAFFYHSNCKKPCIVGVMRIVEEHSVDESAFDPDHPYYDPKSDRAKPKWELVKVEFVKKFEDPIGLKELRSFARDGGALEGMQMLKQSRLSVSAVSPQEWRFILELAGEQLGLGQPSRSNGYEGDTDGEAEAHEDETGKLAASSFEAESMVVNSANGVAEDGIADEETGKSGLGNERYHFGHANAADEPQQAYTTVSLGDGRGNADLT